MVGAGAGLVMVPFMFYLNLNARVASATSGMMYFFVSTSSMVKIIMSATLSTENIIWYILLGLIGGK
jgi:uncharacterized membrane protein YfcA